MSFHIGIETKLNCTFPLRVMIDVASESHISSNLRREIFKLYKMFLNCHFKICIFIP